MTNKLLLMATVVSLSGFGTLMPVVAHGDTLSDLMSQIAALQAQLLALQGSSSSSSATSSALLSSGNLTLGSKGAAVMELQKFLNANGAKVSASGAGSPGNETSYFGPATKAALAKWQAANGVSPAAGYFGAITRAKMASVGGTTATTTGGTTPAPALIPVPAQVESVNIPPSNDVLAPVISEPLPKLLVNDLKFNVDFPIIQFRNYLEFPLFEFMVESNENIAITRLRFKQVGSLSDGLIDNFRLVDANNGSEVLLAKFGSNPSGGFIDFVMVPDENKINKGLVVPKRRYKVLSTVTVFYGVIKPTVSLSIESSSDISVFDFNNLDRAADIPASIFPIGGPIYTISL